MVDRLLIFIMLVSDNDDTHSKLRRPANYGAGIEARPWWLNTSIEYNVDHAKRLGHRFVLNQVPPPPILDWQKARIPNQCRSNKDTECELKVTANYHRENANWMKLQVIHDYLTADEADYILFLDADAILYSQPGHDPARAFIALLEEKGVDMQWADEDWDYRNGHRKGDINGGVILTKNTEWSKTYLEALLSEHTASGRCGANEQMCFRMGFGADLKGAKTHVNVASGTVWNRLPNYEPIEYRGETTEIVHFMGGAKGGFNNLDVHAVGACPGTYCHNIDHCAWRKQSKVPSKTAMVLIHECVSTDADRFSKHHLQIKAFYAEAKRIGSQPLIIMPDDSIAPHPPKAGELLELTNHGFKIVRVGWIDPPGAHSSLPTGSACGSKGYLILHALGLQGYDAVVVYDEQVVVQHGTENLMVCAAQKRLITTSSPTSPISSAVVAVKPNAEHFLAAMKFVQSVQLSKSNTTAGSIWMDDANDDGGGVIPESDCGIGVLHALFYGDRYHSTAETIFRSLGLVNKKEEYYDHVVRPKALKLDRCAWNRHADDAATCEAIHHDAAKHTCSSAKVSQSGAGECFDI